MLGLMGVGVVGVGVGCGFVGVGLVACLGIGWREPDDGELEPTEEDG